MRTLLLTGYLVLWSCANASAQVIAMPSYQDLGRVLAPGQRSTSISFMNTSGQPISNFSAYCTGDFSSFTCNSSCFSLSAYGSCTVWVTFAPHSSDGLRKTITVQAVGSGIFTQAQVSGTDEKSANE